MSEVPAERLFSGSAVSRVSSTLVADPDDAAMFKKTATPIVTDQEGSGAEDD
jgi:hypothetical protein